MAMTIRLLDIPFESMARDARGNFDKNAPLVAGTSKIINMMDRLIVVADIDGFVQPFYLSTGLGGKKTVPAGHWYPFFGIGDDLWINKLHSADMAAYYNNDVFQKICTALDARLGDIRASADTYPKPSGRSHRAIDFINQSFGRVAANGRPDTLEIVTHNVAMASGHATVAWRRSQLRDATTQIATSTPNASMPPRSTPGHDRD